MVVETGANPKHAVVWLHGLGADGHDFEPIVPQLGCASTRPVRFVFPHAPVRPVTINGGMAMRAWYDILGMAIDRDQDQAGIEASLKQVHGLLDGLVADGIPENHIVLAGFSQGGAIALRAGLARERPLAGVIGLSCYLLDAAGLDDWMSDAGRRLPVFMAHGSEDPVVPVDLGRSSAEALKQAGVAVEWLTWPMPHSVCPDEVRAIDGWLERAWA